MYLAKEREMSINVKYSSSGSESLMCHTMVLCQKDTHTMSFANESRPIYCRFHLKGNAIQLQIRHPALPLPDPIFPLLGVGGPVACGARERERESDAILLGYGQLPASQPANQPRCSDGSPPSPPSLAVILAPSGRHSKYLSYSQCGFTSAVSWVTSDIFPVSKLVHLGA